MSSNVAIAEQVLNNAIANISQLTGLCQKEALALLSSQANLSNQVPLVPYTALINRNESQFIANLFH